VRAPTRQELANIWLGLWGLSLALPAVVTNPIGHDDVGYGWMILMTGWLGPFIGQFAWLANVLFFFVLRFLRRGWSDNGLPGLSAIFTGLGAVNALFWRRMFFDSGYEPIVRHGAGYYVWLIAMFGGAGSLAWYLIQEHWQAKETVP
jgi:hypothetical protein